MVKDTRGLPAQSKDSTREIRDLSASRWRIFALGALTMHTAHPEGLRRVVGDWRTIFRRRCVARLSWAMLLTAMLLCAGCGGAAAVPGRSVSPTPRGQRAATPSATVPDAKGLGKEGSAVLPTLNSMSGDERNAVHSDAPVRVLSGSTSTPHPYLVRPARWPTGWPWPPDREVIDALGETPPAPYP